MSNNQPNTPESQGQAKDASLPHSEELDAILQRIAKHIADVERKQGDPQSSASSDAKAPPADSLDNAPSIRKQPKSAVTEAPDAAARLREAVPGTSHKFPSDPSTVAPTPAAATDPTEFGRPQMRLDARGAEPAPINTATPAKLAEEAPGAGVAARSGSSAPLPPAPEAEASDADAMTWDRQAAEAVTRMYESADAPTPPEPVAMATAAAPTEAAPPAELMGLPAMPLMAAAAGLADTPAPQAAAISDDQLDALSRRIEAAFDRFAPMAAVDGLTGRFDQLEDRIVSALDTLADRAGASAPDNLADQIAALTSQLNEAESKFARFDDVQATLDTLSARLSDDHVVQLFGSLVPTAEELTQFAEDAAGRAAERALEGHARLLGERDASEASHISSPGSSQELQTLTAALADFMDDRRRNDDGIGEALETLQLAMRHMLDRMDQIETGAPAPAPAFAHQPIQAPEPHHHHAEPAAEIGSDRDHQRLAMVADTMATRDGHHLDNAPLDSAHHFDATNEQPRSPHHDHAPQHRDQADAMTAEADEADMAAASKFRDMRPGSQAEIVAPTPPPISPTADRRAFIEQARRAAERASAEAAAAPATKAPRGKAPRETPAPTVDGPVAAGAVNALRPQIRPGIMLVALLAVVLLAGYWFLGGPRSNLMGNIRNMIGEATPAAAPAAPAPALVNAPAGNAPDIAPQSQQTGAAETAPAPAPEKRVDLTPPANQEPGPTLANAIVQGGPEVSGPTGVSLAMGQATSDLERMMRAREQNRLARLSQRTAQNAAALLGQSPPAFPPGVDPSIAKRITVASAAPAPASAPQAQAPRPAAIPAPELAKTEAVVTGSVSEAPARQAGAVAAQAPQTLELPPAPIGPMSLRVAAAKGDPSAQLEIAARFAEGKGVRRNLAAASDWYKRAAGQGNAVAQYRLAAQYERGIGIAADPVQARLWYERAASQGNIKAMHNLAVTLANSNGGQPDYTKASKWFSAAAEHGLADSQYNLAILLESGYGVAKDPVAALKWYMLAAKRGDTDAANRRDQLIARLPQSGVQAANAAVNGWRPKVANRLVNDAKASGDTWKRNRTASR